MKKGYIQSISSVAEVHKIVTMMNNVGIEYDKIAINQPFADFANTLVEGDVVVVYSFDYFKNLAELMNTTIEFSERGIQLESLTDSWYDTSPELQTLLKGITELAYRLYTKRVQARYTKVKGRRIARQKYLTASKNKIIFIEKIHKVSIVNIVKTCASWECISRNYFRYFK